MKPNPQAVLVSLGSVPVASAMLPGEDILAEFTREMSEVADLPETETLIHELRSGAIQKPEFHRRLANIHHDFTHRS